MKSGFVGIVGREVFETYVAFISGFVDLIEDIRIIDFTVLELVSSGYARGVNVSYVVDIVKRVVDEIAFHELHMIHIVKQLDPRAVDGADYFKSDV